MPATDHSPPEYGRAGARRFADSSTPSNFIEALSKRTGLALPETDYPAVNTLDGCADRTSGE